MNKSCCAIDFEDIQGWQRALPRVREAPDIMIEDPCAYLKPESLELPDISGAVHQYTYADSTHGYC